MIPNTKGHVTAKNTDRKLQHDKHTQLLSLFSGSLVMVRNYHGPNKWMPGVVKKKRRMVTYDVEVAKGRTVKRHVDQLRLRDSNTENSLFDPRRC